MVQDASLRALKFFGGFRGGNSRAWFLTIVRNTFYNWLEKNRPGEVSMAGDEELLVIEDPAVNPELLIERSANVEAVRSAIEQLPAEFREVIVARELEECSLAGNVADIAGHCPSAQ